MYSVKRDTGEVLCHGCLSADRSLTFLKNYELFFTLLGNKHSQEEYKYLNILLCWECHALLRRTQAFRQRLQRAQLALTLAHAQRTSTETLSTLKYNHKHDYDCSIKESIESKPVDQFIGNSPEIIIKEELVADQFIQNSPEIDIKEEFDADIYEIDRCDSNHKDIDTYKADKEIVPQKKKTYKKDREKKQLQKIDSSIDLSNLDKYFSEVCLSEKEVEGILAREREEDFSRPHKCDICGFQFASKTDLYSHRKNMHRLRVTTGKCPQCSSPYKTQWELELHCWRSHAAWRCALCGALVGQARDRRRHLLRHRRRYRCRDCGVGFDNKQLFLYHEKQLHSKYICDHCGHDSAAKKTLEKHVVRHHLPNKCSVCNLLFPTWDRLRRHTRDVHARSGPAYCVECDVTFATRAKYKRHLSQAQRHRPRKKISVPCPECGKVFSRRNYMNNHRKLFHSNQSRHHCQLCDKYFVTGFSLRSHNKYVHEKIPMPKTKICSVCGRGFGTNRVLENHMRTHTGERPFACAHCAAAFAQRVALKAHLAAIHKEK